MTKQPAAKTLQDVALRLTQTLLAYDIGQRTARQRLSFVCGELTRIRDQIREAVREA